LAALLARKDSLVHVDIVGGADVGASCLVLSAADRRILVDAGLRLSGTGDMLPDLARLQEHGGIDAVIVTHAHAEPALRRLVEKHGNAFITPDGAVRAVSAPEKQRCSARRGPSPLCYIDGRTRPDLPRKDLIIVGGEFARSLHQPGPRAIHSFVTKGIQ
jgi:glyoxylase-like metal-dependent hydrolase (beta-lactamase superfamily II)